MEVEREGEEDGGAGDAGGGVLSSFERGVVVAVVAVLVVVDVASGAGWRVTDAMWPQDQVVKVSIDMVLFWGGFSWVFGVWILGVGLDVGLLACCCVRKDSPFSTRSDDTLLLQDALGGRRRL